MLAAVAVVLLLGLGLTAAGVRWRATEERADRASALGALADDSVARITSALLRYADLLQSLTAFQAPPDRSMAEYQAFIERMGMARFPGVDNTAFIGSVSDDELAAFVAERRSEGQTGYAVQGAVEGSEHALVAYAAPEPSAALGLDLFSDPTRREALVHARDTGVPSLSGVVSPIAERDLPPALQAPSVVVYAAVYEPGAPTATVAERRAALVGWSAIAVDIDGILTSLDLGESVLDVAMLVDDGSGSLVLAGENRTGAAERIAATDVSEASTLPVGEVEIEIRTAFAPGEQPPVDTRLIAIAGVVITLLVAYGLFTTLRFRRGLLVRAEIERQRAELLSSRFHAAVDRAPVGVTVVGLDGAVELANDRLMELLHVEPSEELVIYDYFRPEDLEELADNFESLTSGEVDHLVRERQLRRTDGSYVWCRISSSTLPGPDGSPVAVVAHVEDIEAELGAIEELRSRTRWFSSIVERSSDLVSLIDRQGTISWMSPSAAAILGAEPEQFVGLPVLDFIVPEDRDRVLDAIARVQAGESVTVEYRVTDVRGRVIWLESTGSDLLDDPDVQAIITLSRDVTQRHRDAEDLAHRASHDPLTGLLNRSELRSRLESALSALGSGTPLAVAYLDLDGFKPINDAYGHAVGDELLRVVASVLHDEVRSADVLARVGGDEFVIGLQGADLSSALAITDRVRRRLHQPITLEGAPEPVHISVSVGLAAAAVGDTVDSLLHEADVALYEAKRRGRDRVEISSHGLAALGVEVDDLLQQALRDFE